MDREVEEIDVLLRSLPFEIWLKISRSIAEDEAKEQPEQLADA